MGQSDYWIWSHLIRWSEKVNVWKDMMSVGWLTPGDKDANVCWLCQLTHSRHISCAYCPSPPPAGQTLNLHCVAKGGLCHIAVGSTVPVKYPVEKTRMQALPLSVDTPSEHFLCTLNHHGPLQAKHCVYKVCRKLLEEANMIPPCGFAALWSVSPREDIRTHFHCRIRKLEMGKSCTLVWNASITI